MQDIGPGNAGEVRKTGSVLFKGLEFSCEDMNVLREIHQARLSMLSEGWRLEFQDQGREQSFPSGVVLHFSELGQPLL